MSKLIQTNTFTTVVGDELVSDDLPEGTFIYVADLKALPIDKKDPYTQRIHVLGHKSSNKAELELDGILLIDPKNLKPVANGKNKKMLRQLEKWVEKMDETSH